MKYFRGGKHITITPKDIYLETLVWKDLTYEEIQDQIDMAVSVWRKELEQMVSKYIKEAK